MKFQSNLKRNYLLGLTVCFLAVLMSFSSAINRAKTNQKNHQSNSKTINEMKKSDFTTTILVDQSPEEVFTAISNVKGWWSDETEGVTDKLNGEFFYHYKDVHLCKLKVVEYVPYEKIVWLVLENNFSFTTDKTEWNNTKISCEISKVGAQTQLKFVHFGLVPQYECYNVCEESWTNYIQNSLKSLITTGKGQPNTKTDDEFNWSMVEKWQLKN